MVKEFATNTNLLVFNKEHIDRDMDALIPVYSAHGIRNLDLNFCEMMRPESRLNDGRAKSYIQRLKTLKEDLSLNYIQAHAPYPIRGTSASLWDEKIIRALNFASELGCPHIVVHPIGKDIYENIKYYERLARESDITIAIENMEGEEEITSADEINEIIKSNPFRLKALLDTGHAHIRGLDIKKEIIGYGENLVGLHVHDNDGEKDQHLFPFMGTIDWSAVLEGLEEINYKGYFTYETMFYSREKSIKDEEEVIDKALSSFHRLF